MIDDTPALVNTTQPVSTQNTSLNPSSASASPGRVAKPWAIYYNIYMLCVWAIVCAQFFIILYSEITYFYHHYRPEFDYCSQFNSNRTICEPVFTMGRCQPRKKGDDICGPSDPLYADQYVIVRCFAAYIMIHIGKLVFTIIQCGCLANNKSHSTEHPGTINTITMLLLLPRYALNLRYLPELNFHLILCYIVDFASDVGLSIVLAYYYESYVSSSLTKVIYVLSAIIILPILSHLFIFRKTCYCEYEVVADSIDEQLEDTTTSNVNNISSSQEIQPEDKTR